MASQDAGNDSKIYALINYEDPYVQPLILKALENRQTSESFELISSLESLPASTSRALQFLQYESLDFSHLLEHPTTSLANAYVIRKALIRKHYLSTTVANWITKHPNSALAKGVKPSVEFEVDYAAFLDDALVEAFELRESWERGEGKESSEREWWILKPGMSERGQGIRLFSSEEELTEIFEEWDPESDDEEEDDADARSDQDGRDEGEATGNGIITSQLRHFIAQPYIHPPLLLSPTNQPEDGSVRKFHIRTYVVAVGALKVYVYKPMLALFAARPYTAPWESPNDDESLRAHLTNTCLQDSSERDGSVAAFWSLSDHLPNDVKVESTTPWKDKVFEQVCKLTGEIFEAAARSMSIHFQPLPNSFEIFGLDFMIGIESDASLQTYLLEVNAFPDFRQTGQELKGLVEGLFEGVVDVGIAPFFDFKDTTDGRVDNMRKVLDVDLGRR
ncbi:tubulin-tyrosine ligase [Aaosphaeria arxii CBS 175.79]|uniref:Tubulin-tyrosine ligase n=1 Tax=Aaosphaeria arxii CBS 175.79 TaxID=1450172 RepID=A0A6A5Y8F6_9PLEO|nr:tubulin-tyrosine ligase [Aaosphaeria arxii CBS 175.79]KAF2021523.1 tubulin-tyrosine ligase [Aaosphaeria arxii CBS 175.79]